MLSVPCQPIEPDTDTSNCGCDWDGGDCCGKQNKYTHCINCQCKVQLNRLTAVEGYGYDELCLCRVCGWVCGWVGDELRLRVRVDRSRFQKVSLFLPSLPQFPALLYLTMHLNYSQSPQDQEYIKSKPSCSGSCEVRRTSDTHSTLFSLSLSLSLYT